MTTDTPKAVAAAEAEALAQEVSVLRQELAALRRQQRAMWSMLADAGRHLQVSSASIKAAVSSLLDHEIFWDVSNQHEFLETIDASVDQVGRQIRLLALTFQSEAGRLELKREPNVLLEILSAVEAQRLDRFPRLQLDRPWPPVGKPVLADDEQLTLALELLLEVLAGRPEAKALRVRAQEEPGSWQIILAGLEAVTAALITAQLGQPPAELAEASHLPAENRLRLLVACRLLALHGVHAWVETAEDVALHLRLPAVAGPARLTE